MKKRILSLLLALVMLLGMLPTVALAADDGWDGTTKTEPEKSGGVYQISTAAELAWFRDEVNSGKSTLNATLTADIDLNNQEWTPIGQGYSAQFTGTFDGNQHTISGLKIDKTTDNAMGLFGSISSSAMIKNLIVKGSVSVTVASSAYMPVYVGSVVGQSNGNTTFIQVASYVNVTCTNENSSAAAAVGGLIGNGYSTTIQSCANYGALTVEGKGDANVGGLSGMSPWGGKVTILNSLNAGTVTGPNAGGLISIAGKDYSGNGSTITDSATLGEAVGKNESGTFTNCYAGSNANNISGIAVKDLKSDEVLTALGSAFIAGANYPILTWMTESGAPEQPKECKTPRRRPPTRANTTAPIPSPSPAMSATPWSARPRSPAPRRRQMHQVQLLPARPHGNDLHTKRRRHDPHRHRHLHGLQRKGQ